MLLHETAVISPLTSLLHFDRDPRSPKGVEMIHAPVRESQNVSVRGGTQRPSSYSTEAQRGEETCPRSHSKSRAGKQLSCLWISIKVLSRPGAPSEMVGGEGPSPINWLECRQVPGCFGDQEPWLSARAFCVPVSPSFWVSASSFAKETIVPALLPSSQAVQL